MGLYAVIDVVSKFQLGICIMVVQETLDLLVVVRFHHPLPIRLPIVVYDTTICKWNDKI